MSFTVEFSESFEEWWHTLDQGTQESVMFSIHLLGAMGPALPFPYSSRIRGSSHHQMRELRVWHGGRAYRVFCLFDLRRIAVLLTGGAKDGSARWYKRYIKQADRIYYTHLAGLGKI